MLYRTALKGGSLRSPPGGFAASSAIGGACGGSDPHTPHGAGPEPGPTPGATRPSCPASREIGGTSSVCSALPTLGSVGALRAFARRPASASGCAPGLGPWPLRGRWPRLGSPPPSASRARALALAVASRRCRRLRGRLAYRLGACARRRGGGAPPAGRAAARPAPAGGGFAAPPASSPSSAGLGRGALVACRAFPARCAPVAARPAPRSRRAGAPCPPPAGRPGFRPGPPRLLPPGGGWGGFAAPFSAAAPLRKEYQAFGLWSRASQVAIRPPLTTARPPDAWSLRGAAEICANLFLDFIEHMCYHKPCKGDTQPLALRCPHGQSGWVPFFFYGLNHPNPLPSPAP